MTRKLLITALMFITGSVFTSAQAQEKKAAKEVIAVYHFTTARDYTYDYAIGAGNAIEAGILRSKRFSVVERTRFGTIKEEDKFKEANTSDLVNKAGKMGAKTLVTGHITGVSRGDIVEKDGRLSGKEYVEISLSFKIIDVNTGEIKLSETLRGKGIGKNYAEAVQNAYGVIDKLGRAQIGAYLPQSFLYMNTVATKSGKSEEYLTQFKIWGGSEDGLKPEDALEISIVNTITNPNTGEKVEEKQLIGYAKIDEVNSGSTATCSLIEPKKKDFGATLLRLLKENPKQISIEYKGRWHEKRSWLDF